MIACTIEQSLTTAAVTYPIERGWVEPPEGLELVPRLTAEQVAERRACALLGSIDAAFLAADYAVVTDLALVSHHSGSIALWTATRPDEIDHTVVALDDVSRTAEAVARATIAHFYGIQVTGWDRTTGERDAAVREGVAAFQPPATGQLGDLVRAWFILSGFPLPTHLLVAPREVVAEDPDSVRRLVQQLQHLLAVSSERRREMRRNLAEDLGLDRERLVAFQNDQTFTASKTVRKAWLDLIRRTSRAMRLPAVDEPAIFTAREGA
ncbi:MAG: hypothetical protein QJR03_00690 [Sphaerobacter sp.]|nr:hypothetical protein [Sphaerobacter sp.]